MSKEMKDFLSQFMNQPATQPTEIAANKVVEKKERKPNVEKKIEVSIEPKSVVQPKPTKVSKEITKPQKTLNTVEETLYTEGVEEMLSAEVFLQSINDKKYTFDKKKNLQIDDQLFAILNLLKQHEGIKSIATLLNALIEKYIDDNKVELKKILSKNPLS
jgi:hypothetical protein